jgi:hypothetical protein
VSGANLRAATGVKTQITNFSSGTNFSCGRFASLPLSELRRSCDTLNLKIM